MRIRKRGPGTHPKTRILPRVFGAGYKRLVVAAAIVLVPAVIFYAIIAPSVITGNYLERSDRQLKLANDALNRVAASTRLPLFNDPDVSLPERQKQLDEASARIKSAQKLLDDFGRSSRLQTLPGTDLANGYRAAVVRQEKSQNIVSQSRQVLAEYSGLLVYLKAYTGLQLQLNKSLETFNNVEDFDAFGGRGSTMLASASLVESYEAILRTLTPPAGFTGLQNEALASFGRAKDGFEQLGTGLNNSNDSQIYQAVSQLEAVTAKNQSSDKSTLVGQADKSPILQKVADLPEKTESARGL